MCGNKVKKERILCLECGSDIREAKFKINLANSYLFETVEIKGKEIKRDLENPNTFYPYDK